MGYNLEDAEELNGRKGRDSSSNTWLRGGGADPCRSTLPAAVPAAAVTCPCSWWCCRVPLGRVESNPRGSQSQPERKRMRWGEIPRGRPPMY